MMRCRPTNRLTSSTTAKPRCCCYLPDLAGKAEALEPLLGSDLAYQSTGHMDELCDPGPASGPAAATALHRECAVLYTSGSTGKPKGCILANDYFLLSGRRYVELGGLCSLEPGCERLVTPLPLVHMNAMACSTVAMIMAGGCLIQLDRFHPRSWWQIVRDSRASIAALPRRDARHAAGHGAGGRHRR